ncbi:MAG TPA: 2Fe-2S iron-sulfur cluster-binding protein [Burkholderiaceae bacterium]
MPHEKNFEVRIVPQDQAWPCAPDQTLLLSALAAGLRLPHSCRNGTCRACIAQLLEGQIEYLIEWPGLSAEEKAEGWVLPCVACPRSDVLLQLQSL